MKKLTLILWLVCSINANEAMFDAQAISRLKSGGFIGVNLGSGLAINANVSCYGVCKIEGATYHDIISTTKLVHLDVGILGGYTHFFIPYVGLRGYVGFDYGLGIGERKTTLDNKIDRLQDKKSAIANYYLLNFGADLLIEYIFGSDSRFSIGAILGVGGGYMMYRPNVTFNDFNKFGFSANLGLGFGFLYKHRIELLAKLVPFRGLNSYDDVTYSHAGSITRGHKQAKWLGVINYNYTF